MNATKTYAPLSRAAAVGLLGLLPVTALLGCTENAPPLAPEADSPLGGMIPDRTTDVIDIVADSTPNPGQVTGPDGGAGAPEEEAVPLGPSSRTGDDQAMGDEEEEDVPSPDPQGDGAPSAGSSRGGAQRGSGPQEPPPPRANACDQVQVKAGNQQAVAGSGVIAAHRVLVSQVPQLRIESAFRAELTVDPQHVGEVALTVRADDNVLPFVAVEVREGALVVGMKDGAYCLTELSVEGTVGPLSGLSAINGSKVQIRGLQGQAVSVSAESGSEIDASGQAQRWDLRFENASKGTLAIGSATTVDLELENASAVSLAGSAIQTLLVADTASELLATTPSFETQTAQVDVSGISSARLCVSDAVVGSVQGLSNLRVACNGMIDVVGSAMRE